MHIDSSNTSTLLSDELRATTERQKEGAVHLMMKCGQDRVKRKKILCNSCNRWDWIGMDLD